MFFIFGIRMCLNPLLFIFLPVFITTNDSKNEHQILAMLLLLAHTALNPGFKQSLGQYLYKSWAGLACSLSGLIMMSGIGFYQKMKGLDIINSGVIGSFFILSLINAFHLFFKKSQNNLTANKNLLDELTASQYVTYATKEESNE